MADEKFKGIVELPDDDAYKILIETGKYSDGETEITYNPNWLYVTPNTVASNIAQQKLQIEDLYSKLNNTVTVDSVQTITGPKTFQESIYLANTDGTTDRIAHINNNFIIYSGANNGVALLNIDEGLGTISAFNKQLAFKDDITGGGGGGTGNTTVYVADTAVEEVRFDSDPQTQITSKVSQEDFDKLLNNEIQINSTRGYYTNFYIGGANNLKYSPQNSILIGAYSNAADNDVSYSVAIGMNSSVHNSCIAIGQQAVSDARSSIAIGSGSTLYGGAVVRYDAVNAIQLGQGTNITPNSLQIFDDNIYNHNTHTLTVQNIELNGTNITTAFDEKYLPLTGGTLTGGLSINGNLTLVGDITQQGNSYITHAEQVYSTKDYIYLREGNTGALAEGAYTGFEFIKYDGTNNGRLVVDNKGIARVGDVGEEQPLATREEEPISNGFAKWDAATNKFITTTDVATKTTTDSLSQQLGTFAVELANTQQELVNTQNDVSDLDGELSNKTNVTVNNVHQDTINFTSDPQTQIDELKSQSNGGAQIIYSGAPIEMSNSTTAPYESLKFTGTTNYAIFKLPEVSLKSGELYTVEIKQLILGSFISIATYNGVLGSGNTGVAMYGVIKNQNVSTITTPSMCKLEILGLFERYLYVYVSSDFDIIRTYSVDEFEIVIKKY